jgi:geranylgeranylglycerol-phosphate geranylgeranyltransferase
MLELIRPLNCLLAGLAVLIGAIVAGVGELPYVAGVAFAAAALISGAGNAVNDYFDKDIDAVNRPHRPIPSGMLSARTAVTLGSGLFGVGVVLAALINLPCLALAALNSAILVIYSAELKRRGLAGNLTIGYLVGSTFLFGGLAVGEISVVGILAIMAALSTVGRELIKGIEDMRGDRKLGLRTFPLRYGAGKAAVLAIGFIGAAIAISPLPYVLEAFGWAYLVLVVPSIVVFIAAAAIIVQSRKPEAAGRASLACKIAMGLGLLAFLAGVLAKL